MMSVCMAWRHDVYLALQRDREVAAKAVAGVAEAETDTPSAKRAKVTQAKKNEETTVFSPKTKKKSKKKRSLSCFPCGLGAIGAPSFSSSHEKQTT